MLRSKNNNLIWNGSGPRLETGHPVIGYKWLNRRGKRGSLTLEKFRKFLKRFPLPRPLIRVNLLASK